MGHPDHCAIRDVIPDKLWNEAIRAGVPPGQIIRLVHKYLAQVDPAVIVAGADTNHTRMGKRK